MNNLNDLFDTNEKLQDVYPKIGLELFANISFYYNKNKKKINKGNIINENNKKLLQKIMKDSSLIKNSIHVNKEVKHYHIYKKLLKRYKLIGFNSQKSKEPLQKSLLI